MTCERTKGYQERENDRNINKLRSLADERAFVTRLINGGKTITLEALRIHFPAANEKVQFAAIKSQTYLSKPLVDADGEVLFGELAIFRHLQKDGWEGVWVDIHGRGRNKVVWSAMPPGGAATLPEHAPDVYDRIVEMNGGKSSGFDVFAWKARNEGHGAEAFDYIFLEFKGKGDSPNKNELRWIEAAINAGIKQEQLFIVTYGRLNRGNNHLK